MARIRSIKPEFWQDERLGACSRDVRLLFLGLISNADDQGRLRGNARLVRALVFPYDEDVDVDRGLAMLEAHGRIQRYEAGGEHLIAIINWKKHQKVDHPGGPYLPEPPPFTHPPTMPNEGSRDTRETLAPARETLAPDQDGIRMGSGPGLDPVRNVPANAGRSDAAGGQKQPSIAQAPPATGPGHNDDDGEPVGIADASQPKPPVEVLKLVPSGPRPRKLSDQQGFYAWAQRIRLEVTDEPDQDWSVARVNKALAGPVQGANQETLSLAYWQFLDDPRKGSLHPPWPMWAFSQDWKQYVQAVEREASDG